MTQNYDLERYSGLQMSESALKISNIVTQTVNNHKIRGFIQKNEKSDVELLF